MCSRPLYSIAKSIYCSLASTILVCKLIIYLSAKVWDIKFILVTVYANRCYLLSLLIDSIIYNLFHFLFTSESQVPACSLDLTCRITICTHNLFGVDYFQNSTINTHKEAFRSFAPKQRVGGGNTKFGVQKVNSAALVNTQVSLLYIYYILFLCSFLSFSLISIYLSTGF